MNGAPAPLSLRLIASAAPGIEAEVRANRFRADVYRRMSALRIELPPLADRAEDVPALAAHLLAEFCADNGQPPRTFTPAALALLGVMSWPGNLAELRETVDRAAAASAANPIPVEALLPTLRFDRTPAVFRP
jgi:DNA-binding NtrC family response regulator